MGIYERKILRKKKEGKHIFYQEKTKIQEKMKGHKISTKKKKRKKTKSRRRKKACFPLFLNSHFWNGKDGGRQENKWFTSVAIYFCLVIRKKNNKKYVEFIFSGSAFEMREHSYNQPFSLLPKILTFSQPHASVTPAVWVRICIVWQFPLFKPHTQKINKSFFLYFVSSSIYRGFKEFWPELSKTKMSIS